MSHSEPDRPTEPFAGAPLLGPAVSLRQGAARAATPALDQPLPPFSGRSRSTAVVAAATPITPELETIAAPAPLGGSQEEVELPWASAAEPWAEQPLPPQQEAETPAEPAPAFAVEAESFATEEPTWLEFDAADDLSLMGDAVEAEAAPGVAEPSSGESLIGEELVAPPAWEYGLETSLPQLERSEAMLGGPMEVPVEEEAPEPAAEAAQPEPFAVLEPEPIPELEGEPVPPAPSPPAVPGLEDVASKLEQIARTLRERNPAELLASTDDPLQVLIAGYALGLAARGRSPAKGGEETGA